MLINNENKYGYSIHKVTKYLDDGEILPKSKEHFTSSENELSTNHKRLEHQEVFKDLVNFKLTLNRKKIQFLFCISFDHYHEQN